MVGLAGGKTAASMPRRAAGSSARTCRRPRCRRRSRAARAVRGCGSEGARGRSEWLRRLCKLARRAREGRDPQRLLARCAAHRVVSGQWMERGSVLFLGDSPAHCALRVRLRQTFRSIPQPSCGCRVGGHVRGIGQEWSVASARTLRTLLLACSVSGPLLSPQGTFVRKQRGRFSRWRR